MRSEAGEMDFPSFKGSGMLWKRVSGRKWKESKIQSLIHFYFFSDYFPAISMTEGKMFILSDYRVHL